MRCPHTSPNGQETTWTRPTMVRPTSNPRFSYIPPGVLGAAAITDFGLDRELTRSRSSRWSTRPRSTAPPSRACPTGDSTIKHEVRGHRPHRHLRGRLKTSRPRPTPSSAATGIYAITGDRIWRRAPPAWPVTDQVKEQANRRRPSAAYAQMTVNAWIGETKNLKARLAPFNATSHHPVRRLLGLLFTTDNERDAR